MSAIKEIKTLFHIYQRFKFKKNNVIKKSSMIFGTHGTNRDTWFEESVLSKTRHDGRQPSVPHIILALTLFLDVQINLTMSGLVEINYSNQTHTHKLLTGTLGVPVNSINWCSHGVTMNLNLNQFSRTNMLSPPARVANLSFLLST